MRNIDIFQQTHEPHTSRVLPSFDNVNSGACSIGFIQGEYRTIPAIVTEVATENDQWRIVNLVGQNPEKPCFDSCGVLGAYDDEHAKELAVLQVGRMFDGIATDIMETTPQGLMRHLSLAKYHKKHGVIQPWALSELQDVVAQEKPMWDGLELVSHKGQLSNLLFDMQLHDDVHGLLSNFDGLPQLLSDLGAEESGFDSIIVEYQFLEKFMAMLNKAMNQASKGKVQIKDVQTSKPYKRNNVAQVAVSFGMSDGQSATIVFHNPDSTPSKLAPKDTLISWKILMNNRDITGAIQPNQGEGIALPVLAGRIMALINQNSARFTRTQAKKVENEKLLAEAEQRVQDKKDQIDGLDSQIQSLKGELDQIQASVKSNTDDNVQIEHDEYNQILNNIKTFGEGKEGYAGFISNPKPLNKVLDDFKDDLSLSSSTWKVLFYPKNKNDKKFAVMLKDINNEVILTAKHESLDKAYQEAKNVEKGVKKLGGDVLDDELPPHLNALFTILRQGGFDTVDPQNLVWDANGYPMKVEFDAEYSEASVIYDDEFKTKITNNGDDSRFVNQLNALKYHLSDLAKAKAGGVVLKAEAENTYRSIDFSVTDYQGHTSDEFKRADVKGVLGRKIEIAEAVLARKFRNDEYRERIEKSIENAKRMIERWDKVHNPEVINSEQKNNDITYRYALINRPFGIGAQPSDGFIRTEEAESEIATYARYGVAIYNRPLTDDELSKFEMKLIPNGEKIIEMMKVVATELTLHKNANKFAEAIKTGGNSSLELMITKIQKEKYPHVLIGRQQQFLKDISDYFMEIYQQVNEPEVIEGNNVNPDNEFFNQIISGAIEPLTVDMDKIIEIGEKDESNPLFIQALEIVEKALDEATA